MIYLYLFALVLGGILLGASMILGGHGDADASHDVLGGGPALHDPPAGIESLLLAFLSMRFWTFFLAFFGLTGVVLQGFGLVASPIVVAVLSAAMGLACGGAAVWLLRQVGSDTSNSAASATDFVGKSARVLVGFGPGSVGKVRVEARGSTIDLLAVGAGDETFTERDEVIVVEIDGTRAKVARIT